MLPVILLIGCCVYCNDCRQSSISSYYNTGMRDIFVGILFSIAVFLFNYKGYESKDFIASNWAGISAIGVALFGTDQEGYPTSFSGVMHYICATSFFMTLTYFCLILFTKTSGTGQPSLMKILRNKIYKTCGYIMVLCLVMIIIYSVWLSKAIPGLSKLTPVFWLESFALWAFGVSWLVKGEIIFGDD